MNKTRSATHRPFRYLAVALLGLSLVDVITVSGADAKSPKNSIPSETREIGRSVKNRPIMATRYGEEGGKVVVVVGSIHGNEKPGIPIAKDIATQGAQAGYTLWVIETANPDGTAANTRHNARGVDLNRNFPTGWAKQPCPSKNCSGKRAASEPETKALADFLIAVQPRLVVFYHSTGNMVDLPKRGVATPAALLTYARVSGLPATTVSCGSGGCTGTATSHLYANVPTATTFVVELPCDRACLTPTVRQRHIRAFWAASALA